MDCLFCRIVAGQIPAKKVHEDELCVGFLDINPQAPTHALFVPKRHIATVNDLTSEDRELTGHLVFAAGQYAKAQGVADAGFRLAMNCNSDGGQTVFHLHLHLLAGRALTWPPG
ncbi:MAG: histidine triad nucleotide-binding protein [Myxococcus sp.]|nr:histidine triad nucleotide-binding protein [Myxococcus sp.]